MIPIELARGPGPGPRNVLLDLDGQKVVVTWRTWKLLKEGKLSVQGVLPTRSREGV